MIDVRNLNSSNAAANAELSLATGTGGGDPFLSLNAGGVINWGVGVDRSDGGKFKISTYGDNDCAPAGEYAVTITWRQRSGLLKNQFDGPDRLKGKYNNKEQSGLKVTIEKKSQELTPFELTTK